MATLRITYEIDIPLDAVIDAQSLADEYEGDLTAMVEWFEREEGNLFFIVNWDENVKRKQIALF